MHLFVQICVLLLAVEYSFGAGGPTNCHHWPNCVECPPDDKGQRRCNKCQPLYGLDENQEPPQCVACNTIKGCHICNTTKVCDRCYSRANGPDKEGIATCSACCANCESCQKAGSGKCDRCKEGYRLKTDGLCEGCPTHCRKCSSGSTTCDYCDRGYYKVNAGTCSPCIKNCDLCLEATTCERCFEGFYENSRGECVSCGENCQKCDHAGKCSVCKNGKISEKFTCRCADNCRHCNQSGWGNCDNCESGYKITVDRQCERIA